MTWAGAFVDPAIPSGHRLRRSFDPAADRTERRKVVIVGAGIAGLSAARALKQQGISDFVVLEHEYEPGGTALGGRVGGLRHPWGAHYLPTPTAPNEDLAELLREAGVLQDTGTAPKPQYRETALCAAPTERVYFHGHWHAGIYPQEGASPEDRRQRQRFSDAIRAFSTPVGPKGPRPFEIPVARSMDTPQMRALDGMTMSQWLQKNHFTSERLRWFLEYGTRDDFGSDLDEVSAWAALHYHCARTAPTPNGAAEVLTWPEGNAFFVDHLVRGLPPSSLRTGRLVTHVAPLPGGKGEVHSFDRRTGQTVRWMADRIVFALPSFLRPYILKTPEASPIKIPQMSAWLVANILVDEIPAGYGYPLCWDNVIYGSRSLGYVVSTHQMHGHHGPSVMTYYLPLCGKPPAQAREELLALDYRQACDAILADLERPHPNLRKHIQRIDIRRWGHAMARPGVGQAFDSGHRALQNPVGPVHFAHSDLSGMALFEEAFFHGTRAAREVRAALKS